MLQDTPSSNPAVDCGTPPPRMYANYMVLNDTTYQCVAEYKCRRGYRMSGGDEFIQCLSNGVWSPATIDCESKHLHQVAGYIFEMVYFSLLSV